jgi:hypothetical protein
VTVALLEPQIFNFYFQKNIETNCMLFSMVAVASHGLCLAIENASMPGVPANLEKLVEADAQTNNYSANEIDSASQDSSKHVCIIDDFQSEITSASSSFTRHTFPGARVVIACSD